MNVTIISSDPKRRAWLGKAAERHATQISLDADEALVAASGSVTILDGASLGLAAIVSRCRALRHRAEGGIDWLLVVGSDPDLPLGALTELLDAGADDYLALPAQNETGERALERALLTLARRSARAESPSPPNHAFDRLLLEQLPCFIYVQACQASDVPEGVPFRYLFVSPQIESILGYSAQDWMETPGLPVSRVHPDDLNRIIAAARTGNAFRAEYRVRARGGREIWVRDEAVLIWDDDGSPRFWQGFVVDITDQKNGARRLDETEARFRQLVDQLPAVVYLDRNDEIGTPLYMSPKVEELLGYTADEFLSDPDLWERLVYPEDVDRVVAEHLRTNQSGDPFHIEYRLVHRDGRVIWVRDAADLVLGPGGDTLWQGFWLDITEQRSADERLRAAETRYRALIEQMPAMTYITRADERETPVFVSPQIETMTGWPPERWLTQPGLWSERLHPDDRDRVIAAVRHRNGVDAPFHAEYRLRHRDGHDVWIGDEARPIVGDQGEPLWQGVWVDVSRRKEAEVALRESERRYRDLVEHSEGLICTHDLDGRLLSVNLAAARALDYAPGDLIGTNLRDYLLPADRPDFQRYLERTRRQPVVSGQVRLQSRTGEERIWSYRNVRSEAPGQPVHIIAHAHDITARHWAETALRSSESRLRQVLGSEQRKTRELDLLGQVRQALAKEMDLATVIQTVVEGLRDSFGYSLVSLYFIELDRLRLQHQVGYSRIIREIPLDRGVTGRVARTSQPELIANGLSDPDFLQANDDIMAEVCVPLTVGEAVVGILSVESTVVDGLNEDDLRLMVALADVVSVAVGRARLYAALRDSEVRFRTAFDAAPIGMVLLDPALTLLRFNAAFSRMVGIDLDGELTIERTVHSDDWPTLRKVLERVASGGVPVAEMDARFHGVSDQELRGQVSASLIRDDAGEPLYIIVQIQDVTERVALAERLRRLALHDSLTGLANRAHFLERLTDAVGKVGPEEHRPAPLSDRPKEFVAVLYVDLDGFKAVNDLFGHQMGDELLIIVARRLLSAIRPGDLVARFGGDEFTVLLTALDDEGGARLVADRLISALRQPIVLANGRQATIGASVGIATGAPGMTTPDDLLRAADTALYRAKAKGRNSVSLYDPLLESIARAAS